MSVKGMEKVAFQLALRGAIYELLQNVIIYIHFYGSVSWKKPSTTDL
jgi:hypothetical protein